MEAVGGDAMDATASALAQEKKSRLGSGERERSGEGVEHVCCTGKRIGNGRGRRRGAVGRRRMASPWCFDVHPRRACRGRRRVAVREAPGRHQGCGEGWGAARARCVAGGQDVRRRTASRGKTEKGDGVRAFS